MSIATQAVESVFIHLVEAGNNVSSPITDATTNVHAILESLTSDERRRVIQAVLTLLGDDAFFRIPPAPGKTDRGSDNGPGSSQFPSKAQAWMRKNGLHTEHLENYFHFDNGTVTCIELPGGEKTNIKKVINTYLMQGLVALLGKGEAEFADDDARKLCENFGCYDTTNHAKAIGQFANAITGSKSGGWKLTVPGLTAAAALVKA